MKNPCDECLVKPACSQVCWTKKNYGTLLQSATDQYRIYLWKNKTSKQNRDRYKLFKQKTSNHLKDMVRIQTKERDMGRYDEN